MLTNKRRKSHSIYNRLVAVALICGLLFCDGIQTSLTSSITETIATASVTSSSPSSSSNTSVSSSSAAIAAKVSHATVPFTIATTTTTTATTPTPTTPNSISFGPTLTETNKLPANVRDVNNDMVKLQCQVMAQPSLMKCVKGKCVDFICGKRMIELLSTMNNHHRPQENEENSLLGMEDDRDDNASEHSKSSVTIKVIPQITDSLDLHARGSPNPYWD
uniref:Uncharacterized protein n=1 Tax=Glossina austeni TaxID=7395 RepID=A0A1A9VGX2_GLOAU